MNYYKLESPKFLAMLEQAEIVNNVADKAAKKLHAVGYINAMFSDFGGLSAVEFGKRKVVDKNVWECAGAMDKHTFWEPKVTASEEAVPEEELENLVAEDGEAIIVGKDAVSFQHIKALFTRKECFKMAGMDEPSTGDPVEIAQKWLRRRLTNDEFKLLFSSVKTADIFPTINNASALMIITRGREENATMLEAMREKKFKLVTRMKGNPEAIEIWKSWQELPVIPQGMVNGLLGIEDGVHRCGFFVLGENVYFKNEKESTNSDAQIITEEEYEGAKIDALKTVKEE